MAELKRKDEELTTADLAGRTEKSRENESRPQLVRNQEHTESGINPPPPPSQNEMRDANIGSPSSFGDKTSPARIDTAKPYATTDQAQSRPVQSSAGNQPSPLFSETEVGEFRSRWSNIQTAFVDEPRRAVEDADNLVASLMKKLAEGFANERAGLEKQWDSGDNVSTEDLRLALQRYRSFFDRLLKA